ncbi:hypothetical protein [Flavobacterium noncentrifugens]|uniref:Uncharacterized protein n=1 Tax=Flavobacterium noncentrifugens TaxID=1128970 RepID=A0A1G8UXK7_9FLAO|nr:hypothetical protein [Flavobacterium noncentrifugens]SDJ58596.1 hypothetical protein SAMN04487935_1094 [Flavobacterium noncentrifugens]
MKDLKKLNTIALLMPVSTLLFYPWMKDGIFIFALLLTMVTGFLQAIAGLSFWWRFPKNNYIRVYLLSVIIFFPLKYFTDQDWLWGIPLVLCLYLSILIYNSKNTDHENT